MSPNITFKLTASQILREANDVRFVSAVHDGSVAVCFKTEGKTFLGRYDVCTGAKLSGTVLSDEPDGMTSMSLGEKPCLALSFGKPEKRIEWRDIWDLSRIVHIYTPPKINYPGAITASPDGFLGYIDAGVCHGEVVWVDGTTSPPEPSPPVQIGGHHIMHTGTCCEERDVTLTTYWDFSHTVGLYAYNTKTCTELWEVSWKKDDKVAASPEKNENFMDEDSVETENLEKALSLAVDGHGHAFVCDVSKSWVKLYSCRDGSDLGCVIKKGQHGIGNPLLLSWNSAIPSLIVVHKKINKNVLSVLKVKYN